MGSVSDRLKKLLHFSIIVLLISVFVLFHKILSFCPPLFKRFCKWRHKYDAMAITDYSVEDYADSLAEWATWKIWVGQMSQLLYEIVKRGERAPNPTVLSSDGTQEYNLLDFAKPGRPLVLNFGHCSCPVFMAKLANFSRVAANFEKDVDFVTIYISESHATDGWNFVGNR